MSVTKVVILNWNGERHLREFLPSVVAATPSWVGIVVADNGSTDGSVALLEAHFPTVEIVRMERNYGYAGGYNRALEQIDADFYVLMNSDVEAAPGWCEPLVAAMERDNSLAALAPKLLSYSSKERFEYAGAAGGFIDFLGYPFCRGHILNTIEEDRGQYDSFREVFWASGACMMVRASVFRELGGFDAAFFAHMEEIDLCWRMQLRGFHVGSEPASRVFHLGGGTLPNNTPQKIYLNFRNNLAMLYKNLPKGQVEMILFIRMLMDGGSALVYLFQGNIPFFKAVFRAHIDFYKRRPELKVLRRKIQSSAVARSRWIYRGSILLRYIFGRKRFDDVI